MEPRSLSIDDIVVGDVVEFSREWKEEDVATFADLSGDCNPLHMDDGYATTTIFGKRVVHGMLVGSLCSRLVGMYLPGKKSLYLHQSLSFRRPIFIGDTVVVKGKVTHKSDSTSIVSIAIVITKGDDVVVKGEAKVKVLS